jgi:hypothetical protein
MKKLNPSRIPLGPKIAVGFTSLAALGAVFWSHYSQVTDKETMKAGVVRDRERIRMKKKRMMKGREAEERKLHNTSTATQFDSRSPSQESLFIPVSASSLDKGQGS